jgi:predicted ArsR family transcriptional regulator
MKILKILVSSQLTPSQVAKSVGVTYKVALRHLEVLEAEGILGHIMFGKRTRFYRYSEGSRCAAAVRGLIDAFESCEENWNGGDGIKQTSNV